MANATGERDLRVRVDHVGIAVEDRSHIVPVLEALGGSQVADEPADGFRWVQYALGDLSRIEVIEPTADDTFLTEFLDRHGPGLHHVTLEVASLEDMLDHLDRYDIETIDQADKRGYREAFIRPSEAAGVLFQLMEFDAAYGDRFAAGEPFDDRQ